MSTGPANPWNPGGGTTNCAACVARYLHYRITGQYFSDPTGSLDRVSDPAEIHGHAPTEARQKQMAIARTVGIITSVGLREDGRADASVGATRFPAGHYAILGIGGRGGHVVYGHVERDDHYFSEMFCPQSNAAYQIGRLGGRALAIRFVAVGSTPPG